jgi:hypothetical protein
MIVFYLNWKRILVKRAYTVLFVHLRKRGGGHQITSCRVII